MVRQQPMVSPRWPTVQRISRSSAGWLLQRRRCDAACAALPRAVARSACAAPTVGTIFCCPQVALDDLQALLQETRGVMEKLAVRTSPSCPAAASRRTTARCLERLRA